MKNRNKNLILLTIAALSVTMLFSACQNDEDILDESSNETEVSTEMHIETRPSNDVLITQEATIETESSDTSSSKLSLAVEAVTSSVEWAKLSEITDNELIKEFFKLDNENENYNDILVMQCPMSAVTAEIIIIEATDGKVDSAKNDLEARKDKLINVDAFYPDSKAIAENSIVGVYNNIAYFIAGENAADSESVLVKELENQGY